MEQPKTHKKDPLKVTLIVVISILIGLLLIFGIPAIIVFIQTGKQTTEIVKEVDELTIEKELLARDFQDLALDYDSLKTNNDTINLLLDKERERITQLLEEIRMMKSSNAAKINEYKKELASLRNVMKSFVVQIDSLNSRNQELTQENKEVRKEVTRIKDSYQVLEEEKKNLAQKVEIAARLEARNLIVSSLNSKGKETTKISRTTKIRLCFTIGKNVTAPIGEKKVYMRLLRPDEMLLMKSPDDTFVYEGSTINFTAMRVVEYGGDDLDVCLFYDVEEGELMEGDYVADVFADGANIGTTQFTLKK